jgi:predicted nuclease of predicted toxin-antitoxin system
MRLLLDECIPRKFKFSLKPHDCQTVPEAGLSGKQNGELLDLAEGKFEVFVTLDKGLQFQQNLTGRSIAILLIRAKSTVWWMSNSMLRLVWLLSNRISPQII